MSTTAKGKIPCFFEKKSWFFSGFPFKKRIRSLKYRFFVQPWAALTKIPNGFQLGLSYWGEGRGEFLLSFFLQQIETNAYRFFCQIVSRIRNFWSTLYDNTVFLRGFQKRHRKFQIVCGGSGRLAGGRESFSIFCAKKSDYWQITKNPNLLYFGPKRVKNFLKISLNLHFLVFKMPEISGKCSEIFQGVCCPFGEAIATFSPLLRPVWVGGRG